MLVCALPARAASTSTIFTVQVATHEVTSSKPIEVGVKFQADSAGSVLGVRFYKFSSGNSGAHLGHLWSASGQLLASATFAGETASGWQTVLFSTPVAISSHTTYVASYHTATRYSVSRNYFTSAGVDNPPLHALKSGVSGADGVYAYGAGATFPNNGVADSNWWADVVFQPASVGFPPVPGCAKTINVKQDGTGDFTTIQAAVNAVPQPITAATCVVVRDTGTYNEAVSIGSMAPASGSLTVMGDPSLSAYPVVDPPASSQAAFLITQSSGVTLSRFSVLATNPVTNGIHVDVRGIPGLAHVSISSVVIADKGGFVSNIGLFVQGNGVSVSYTTATLSAAEGALFTGAQNAISQSVFTSSGSAGLQLGAADGSAVNNRLSGIVTHAPSSYGLLITLASAGTVVSGSVLEGGGTGLAISNGASGTTISGCSIAGAQIWESNDTTIVGSTITGRPAYAVQLNNAGVTGPSQNFTLSNSVVSGGPIVLGPGSTGFLTLNGDSVSGTKTGLQIFSAVNGPGLSVSSLSFNDPLPPGTTAIDFPQGGTFMSTFTAVAFNSANIAVNVDAVALSTTSSITMAGPQGIRSGAAYANDPHGVIHWPVQPPAIASISPQSVLAGSGAFTLSVFGRDFSPTSVVQLNYSDRPTTFVSSSTLTASISSADVQSPANDQVQVVDQNRSSNAVPFIVLQTTPTAQWTQTGALANDHYGQPAARLLDGRVFVPGGNGESQVPSEIYDPGSDNWTVAGSAQPWTSRSVTTLLDGRVLLAGGRGQECCVADAELFSPGTTSYATTGSLKQPRASDSVTLLLDGRVLAAGGQTDTQNLLASAEIYDPATGIWTLTGSMAAVRFGHAAVRLGDGRVLVAGGSISASTPTATVEIYDPAKGTWSAASPMSTARSGPTAVLLKDGRVLVAGGDSSGVTAELYDPSTGKWTSTGSMSAGHGAATLLPDGSVLVEGGGTNTAERYDPVAGTWRPAGAMHSVMTAQDAVALRSGQVLVVDGAIDAVNRRPERYNPGPFIAALSPSAATAGGPSFTLSVTGLLFSTSSVVQWNGSPRATSFVSASTLTATIPAADIVSTGTAQVSVSDPLGTSKSLAFAIVTAPATSTTTIFTVQVATHEVSVSQPIEVGVKFRSDAAGNVIGVRFYKFSSANSGVHLGHLWSASGQLLASATFAGETASGWQSVLFSTPVAISSGTTYVASYHTTTQYSVSRNYFTGSGVDNAPLHALKSGVSGANGVYAYGAGATFPANGVSDSNWWADVIFQSTGSAQPPPQQPPAIASISPSSAVVGGPGFTLSVFGQRFSTSSVVQWNGSPRATSFVSVSTLTAAIPSSDIASSGTVQIAVSDPAGLSNTQPFTVAPAASTGSTTSIFTAQAPTNAGTASSPIEVGVKFRADSTGNVIGVRFYKLNGSNAGTHLGELWSSSGQLLASATFTNESSSGWQTVLFSNPVPIDANTTYVASYHTTTQYSVTRNYFTSAGVDNAPLHALQSGVSGVNGVYAYGSGPTFPSNGVSDSNWWADVVFQPTGPASAAALNSSTAPPTVSTTAAAADAFGFRDFYVFPNPSRRGQRMTVRLQTGLAESTELKIYDVSGRLIREAAFGEAKIVDDGNGKGPQYTYDYEWDVGGVGSGVYIFSISARKGQDAVNKTGKGAIIK